MDDEVQVGNSGSIAAQDFLKDGWRRREVKIEMPLGAIIHAGPYGPCHLVPPHAILAIRDNAYLSLRASPPLSCYRLNVLVGTAILVPDDREHFALLSVGLDQPGYDLETGAVRRTPTFDESSVDANDHLAWPVYQVFDSRRFPASFSTGGYRRLTPRFLPVSI
jgi:hypothetical protein